MIVLALIIPGFPLFLFIALPPLFCWGTQQEREMEKHHPMLARPRFCSQCGKQLLEPLESYCPRCGAPTSEPED